MKSRMNPVMSMFCSLLLLLSTSGSVSAWGGNDGFPPAYDLLNWQETETNWQRVIPQGEEFSVLTPVALTLLKGNRDYTMSGTSERILDHRIYSGYANDFNFYIESFKAARPKNLLKALDDKRYPLRVFENEIKLTGYTAREHRLAHAQFQGKYFEIVAEKHIYLITLASRSADNNSVERFLSSLLLGYNIKEPATGQVLNVKDSPAYQSALLAKADTVQPSAKAYKSSELSRKAVIVGRPEPNYTDEARQKQLMGTVVLRAVFGADGYVNNIRVVSGLEGGLTGKAIEAALSIRFFPAEKDGQPVSQYIQIEYNFNLY